MPDFQQQLQAAMAHLSEHDPALRPVIEQTGPPLFAPHSDYYGALVSSIIGQQLSVKAAAAIRQRFLDIFGGTMPSPKQLLEVDVERLRAIGFSYAKGRYIHDLAEHILDGRITFDRIPNQSNEDILAALTAVKGIGEWTVHMFLVFSVGRLDVLPVGDIGIRNGMRELYSLEAPATPEQIRNIAASNNWHPYESVACWYVWRSLENEPVLI